MFHVLLPLDTDEARMDRAIKAVAELPNAVETTKVTVLNVKPEINVIADEGGPVSSEDWYDEQEIPEAVQHARAALEDAGIDVTVRREHADPAEAIIEVAEELDVDRIVMTGRRRTPVGKVLFGSVTQSVLLNSHVPVTVTLA